MESHNDTGTNFLPASFIGRAQGHKQTSYKLLSWEEHMDSQRGTQTTNTALYIKLHAFYNYKINNFAGEYKRN
jgi:hypothetical protein